MEYEITIPAMYAGQPDATLYVLDQGGDGFAMSLRVEDEGRTIAAAPGFRPAPGRDFGGGEDAKYTAGTFGAFLAAACEGEGAEHWDVLAHDADEWADALAIYAEGE